MELSERRRIAEHEAAHATVALAVGLRVIHVDLGTTDVEPVEADGGIHRPLNAVAVLLAGEVADPAERLALTAPGTDWDRAWEIARTAVAHEHVGDLMRAGRERAEALLAANRDLHDRLTDALLEHGELDADAIDQLLEAERLQAA